MSMIHEITGGLGLKKAKRKGRGESSGKGKTCGRGTKGAGAHGGDVAWKPGHEGGQTPIHRRLPKRGFSNDAFEHRYCVVNLGELEGRFAAGSSVDAQALAAEGLISDARVPVKILGNGTLNTKLTLKVDWYSKSALARIGELGGEALTAGGQKFELPKPKKKFVKRDAKAATAPAAASAEAAEEQK